MKRKWLSSGLHYVVWRKFAAVSEMLAASLIREIPADEGRKHFRNVVETCVRQQGAAIQKTAISIFTAM
jgi:hypothetical protein